MQLSDRQEKILNLLIKEYLESAQPVSSELLKEESGLSVSTATIRNDLQDLTELGYIKQPHTSAGRVPTQKGYQYYIEVVFYSDNEKQFLEKAIKEAKCQIEEELKAAQELANSLMEISNMLRYDTVAEKENVLEILEIIGPSKTTHTKNVKLINDLIKDLENL
jgi:heat-inducible transcriptional repressor